MIHVVANTSSESGALRASDIIRDEVFRSILLAVRGFRVDSGLSCDSNQVASFLSHGPLLYETSIYIHEFIFEVPLLLTVGDSVQSEATRAFLDIDFNERTDINLDTEPDFELS